MAYRLAMALALSGLALSAAAGVGNDAAGIPPEAMLALLQWGLAAVALVRLHRPAAAGATELQAHALCDVVLFGAVLVATESASSPVASAALLPVLILARAGTGAQVLATAAAAAILLALLSVGAGAPSAWGEPERTQDRVQLDPRLALAALLLLAGSAVAALGRTLGRRARGTPSAAASAIGRPLPVLPAAVPTPGPDIGFAALVAGLAHDLGSPLSSVAVVHGELRRDYAQDPRLQADLALVDVQLQRFRTQLATLVRTCIAGCAPAAEAQPLRCFVDDAARAARERWPGVCLSVQQQPAVAAGPIRPPQVLRQTLDHLLDNAARACRGHVELRVSGDDACLQFEVVDDGPGFDADALSWLGRRPAVHTDPTAGLGCGLALAALVARILGGTLELGSADPRGARVRLQLGRHALSAQVSAQAQLP